MFPKKHLLALKSLKCLNIEKPLPVFLVEGVERDICTKGLSEIEEK
jgi:hypothetical protein